MEEAAFKGRQNIKVNGLRPVAGISVQAVLFVLITDVTSKPIHVPDTLQKFFAYTLHVMLGIVRALLHCQIVIAVNILDTPIQCYSYFLLASFSAVYVASVRMPHFAQSVELLFMHTRRNTASLCMPTPLQRQCTLYFNFPHDITYVHVT